MHPELPVSPKNPCQTANFLQERGGGYSAEHLETQEWSNGNIGFMKSPILNPKRESMMLSDLSPKIIRDSAKKRQVSPHRLSLNRTLNREIRPESAPDSKFSSQKVGDSLAVLRGMSSWRGKSEVNHPPLD